ncbi:MAG: GNAT family N-acetyltransferase [Candidatus Margulisbacteria bacterium]|nr:GNAT family N-acetyltransferase [Candidatus Margulisiibacteriota bacterium]
MIKIRPARQQDRTAIKRLLIDLDLYYSALIMEDFWVAEKDGKIVGAVQFKEYDKFFFLGSLAVLPGARDRGIASSLVKKLIAKVNKPVYLYTIIPDFFKRFGFKETAATAELPSKDQYECEACHSEKCVCMVR